MADEQSIRAAKGKLYNLKSGIEGLLPLLDAGVLQPEQVGPSITALATKSVDDLDKQLNSGDEGH